MTTPPFDRLPFRKRTVGDPNSFPGETKRRDRQVSGPGTPISVDLDHFI